jgi:hypothetical protein
VEEGDFNAGLENPAYRYLAIIRPIIDTQDFAAPIEPDNFSNVGRGIIAPTFIPRSSRGGDYYYVVVRTRFY